MSTTRFTGARIQLTSFHGTHLMAHEHGLVLGSPNRKEWETWTVEDAGDGAVFLVSVHGLALRSEPNGSVNMTTARHGYERWRIEPGDEDGTWFVRSAEHGLDLSMDPEGRVCTTSNRQAWERFSIGVVRPPVAWHAAKTLRAIVGLGQRRLSAQGGAPALVQGDGDERWSVEDAGEGVVRLVGPSGALGRAPDGRIVVGGGPENEARWSLDALAPGAWSIGSVVTGERLVVRDDGSVGLADTIGEAARWRLEFEAPLHAGRRIHLASSHGSQLAARTDGSVVASGERLAQECWEIEDVGEGEFALRSVHGTWLSGRPDRTTCLVGAIGPWERWTAIVRDSGRVMLRSVAHALQLQATPEGTIVLTPNQLAWERWQIELLPSSLVGRVIVLVADGRALGARPGGWVEMTEAQQGLERWQVEDAGDGSVYLVNALGGALSVAPDGALGHAPGREAPQRWMIRRVEPGKFRVTSRAYGHHLTMRDGEATSREPSARTLWSIVDRPRTTSASERFLDRRIVLSSSHGTRLVRTADGAAAARDDGPSSVWTLTRRASGHYQLTAADGSSLAAGRDGTVGVAPTGDDTTQSWTVEQLSPGVFVLTTWYGRNLQARPDGALATHTNTALWEWWRIELAPEAPAWPPVGRRVMLTSHHDTRLSMGPGGEVSTTPGARMWESWAIEDAGDGEVFLVSHHETLLSSKPDGALWATRNRLAWERWRIEATQPGRCRLRSVAHGRWLRAHPDAPPDTAPDAQAWEEWRVDPALIGPLYPSQGEWGEPPASTAAQTRRALTGSPLEAAAQALRGILEGRVLPVLADLQKVFAGRMADTLEAALGQTRAIAEALQATAGATARTLLDELAASPAFQLLVDGRSYAISSPLGRIELVKRGAALGVHWTLRGPGGFRAIVGLANGDPLCTHGGERMANPLLQPTAFVDLQLGHSHVHARAPLGSQQLSVSGEHFFEIGDQWVRARFGVLDPRSHTVEAGLELGLKAGVSIKLNAEMNLRVKVTVSTNPTAAAAALRTLGEALVSAAQEEGLTLREGGSPLQIARVLSRGLGALAGATSQEDAAELGALTLAVEGEGKLGLGVAETVLPLLTATGSASHSLPFLALARLNADVLVGFLEAGAGLGCAVAQLGAGRMAFPGSEALARLAGTVAERGRQFVAALWTALREYLEGATVSLEFQVDALGEKKNAGGETPTQMSFTLFAAGLELPVGAAVARLVEDPELLRRAADAAIAIASELAPKIDRWQTDVASAPAPAPVDWESLSLGTGEGARLSIAAAVTPLARVRFEAPALPVLRALHRTGVEARALIESVVRSAIDGSLEPLRAALARLLPGLGEAAVDLLASCEIGLLVGGGLNFSLGLQVDAELGLGASFTAKTTPGLLLLLGSGGARRLGEATGSVVVTASGSLSGGFSLGVGGKLDGKLSLGGQASLFSFQLQAWDEDLPAASDTRVAGFEVLDFTGKTGRDGALDGSGALVLPSGGTVAASFATDAAGRVLRGSWSADLELGEHRVSVAGGSLDDAGLHGRVELPLGALRTEFALSLAASGDVRLRHEADLELGGVRVASSRLYLTPDGFEGAGRLVVPETIAAEVSLRARRNGDFHARASGKIALFGREFDAAELTVAAYDLSDPNLRGALVAVFPDQQHRIPADARRVAFLGGSARLDVLGSTHQFRIRLVPALGLVDVSSSTTVNVFGFAVSGTRLRLDGSGITGQGHLKLGDLHLTCDFSIGANDEVHATCWGKVKLGAIELASCALTLGHDGASGSGMLLGISVPIRISRNGQLSLG